MGSLRWLSLGGTLLLSACSDGAMPRPADAGATEDSPGTDVWLPEHLDGSIVDATAVACSSRRGYFACGSNLCSRAIQTCEAFIGQAMGSCVWYGNLVSTCGACPTCECLSAHRILTSCQDDDAGGITFSLRPFGVTGDSCKADADCQSAFCRNGVCDCEPAGTMPAMNCCGGSSFGACAASPGTMCTTTATDCYGGPCEGGTCRCVGVHGFCNVDRDCCAGATRCIPSQLRCE